MVVLYSLLAMFNSEFETALKAGTVIGITVTGLYAGGCWIEKLYKENINGETCAWGYKDTGIKAVQYGTAALCTSTMGIWEFVRDVNSEKLRQHALARYGVI